MEFVLPTTNADTLPFASACVTALFGLFAMFAPRVMLSMMGLMTQSTRSEAVADIRATVGGFHLGVAIMGVLFYDQPVVQMTLGAAWLFAAFGRFVSILSDHGSTLYNWLFLFFALALAGLPLASAFGFVVG